MRRARLTFLFIVISCMNYVISVSDSLRDLETTSSQNVFQMMSKAEKEQHILEEYSFFPKTDTSITSHVINYMRSLTTGGAKQMIKVTSYNDYRTFAKECGETKPTYSYDCTNKKYSGYWCCKIDYLSLKEDSYCTPFSDLVAKAKIFDGSQDFKFICASSFYSLLYPLILLITFLIL